VETVTILVVLIILLLFTGLIVFSITNSRNVKQKQTQRTQALVGMTPIEPDAALLAQIAALYPSRADKPRYSLHNVSRRALPDGELFLFDLVDRDIESDSWIERQAVAIRSERLQLPPFQMYPKVNASKYGLGGLANALVEWSVSTVGTPVQFAQFPAFQARYAVSSTNPQAVQTFFDEDKARYFANSEYYNLHAGGHLFTFAEMQPGLKASDVELLSRRINRALEIYRLFQK